MAERTRQDQKEQAAAADIETTFRQAAADLDAAGVTWAVTGGLAVCAYTPPRPTEDVDFAVPAASDDEAEVIIGRLQVRGYVTGMRLDIPVGDEVTGTTDELGNRRRLALARLMRTDRPGPEVFVDLLFALSGIEDLIVEHAQRIDILPGCAAPVASLGHLIAVKLLSARDTRPQDEMDLRALLSVAGPGDLAQARDAVTVIGARGFGEGPVLREDLELRIRQAGR